MVKEGLHPKDGQQEAQCVLWCQSPLSLSLSFQICSVSPSSGRRLRGRHNHLELIATSSGQRWTRAIVQATHHHFLMATPLQGFLWAFPLCSKCEEGWGKK